MAAGDYYLSKSNGTSFDEKIITAVSGRVIGFDASLNPVMLDVSLSTHTHSGYIPYTGGTSNVNLGVHNLTVDTNTLFVDSVNHRVGIGTTSLLSNLQVGSGSINGLTGGTFPAICIAIDSNGISSADGGMLGLVNTGTYGINQGGSFIFAGRYNAGTAIASWARLTGGKENATSGDYSGYFSFATRHTGNVMTERMRIDSNGKVGIGTATPTAYLHLAAGTATAGTAPLKFTSGVNLTTPEAGAIEFNGTNLYFTPSSARLRIPLIPISENAVTFSSGFGYTNRIVKSASSSSVTTQDYIEIRDDVSHGYTGIHMTNSSNVDNIISFSVGDTFVTQQMVSTSTKFLASITHSMNDDSRTGWAYKDTSLDGNNISYALYAENSNLYKGLYIDCKPLGGKFNLIGYEPIDCVNIIIGEPETAVTDLTYGIQSVLLYTDIELRASFNAYYTDLYTVILRHIYRDTTGIPLAQTGSWTGGYNAGNAVYSNVLDLDGNGVTLYEAAYDPNVGVVIKFGDNLWNLNTVLEFYSSATKILTLDSTANMWAVFSSNLQVMDVCLFDSQAYFLEATLAPFTVESNVLVNNLNADFLDGKHASEFELALDSPGVNGMILSSTTAGVRSWIDPPKVLYLNNQFNPVSNTYGSETNAHQYTIAANELSTDGDMLEIVVSGSLVQDATNKTIKFYFGTNSHATFVIGGAPLAGYSIRINLIRISSTSFRVTATASNHYTTGLCQISDSIVTIDFTTTNIIKTTINCATGTNITEKYFTVVKYKV